MSKVRRLTMANFRGVRYGVVHLEGHSLLAGPNNVGKSTVCEALDLLLGPERLSRSPVVDEHDFYASQYLPGEQDRPEIRLEAVLTDLTEEAKRRFAPHLRRWSDIAKDFSDTDQTAGEDAEHGDWCLPILFLARYNPEEDDFEAGTFFAHPQRSPEEMRPEDLAELGSGLKRFTRADKRYCGFLYLRPNRTGNRALTFQRGSLLDTIVSLEAEDAGPLWQTVLDDLAAVEITRAGSAFATIQEQVRERVGAFVTLAAGEGGADLRASELTREHVREVLRLFVATEPGSHLVPFNRLSTGTLNQLVFALLTYIADRKGDKTVIFAIEEPEIALPPHGQRRLVDFAMKNMGQVIVTSHSPYVIEKFPPHSIVVVARDKAGDLVSTNVKLPHDFRPKSYHQNRRQFAEAVLARAVLVVEGATEAAVFRAVADVLDRDPFVQDYQHPDLAGLTFFDAGSDGQVPRFAPVFKHMGKPVYGIHDTPNSPLPADAELKAAEFTKYLVIPFKGIESLLSDEIPVSVQRRFLQEAVRRSDYPYPRCARFDDGMENDVVKRLTKDVLKERKGENDPWAAQLVECCQARSELPPTLVDLLIQIDQELREAPGAGVLPADGGDADGH